MGKIIFLFAALLALPGCFLGYESDSPCPPDFIGSDIYVFQEAGKDTLRPGESIRFQVTRLNPKIQRSVTTERLPYPPTAQLLISAISDTVPPFDSLLRANFTYNAVRPFRVITTPGLSQYLNNYTIALKGEFVGDSVKFDFQLKALTAGLYKISWVEYRPIDRYLGPGMVILDAKTARCNYFWRMVAEFGTNQSFEPYTLAFPGFEPGEKRLNRFIYVQP